MSFETKVMAVVDSELGTNEMNGFAYDTLWVTCQPEEARRLLTTLTKQFGPVEVTPQAGHMEFAFDFTA